LGYPVVDLEFVRSTFKVSCLEIFEAFHRVFEIRDELRKYYVSERPEMQKKVMPQLRDEEYFVILAISNR